MIFLYHINGQGVFKILDSNAVPIDLGVLSPTEALFDLGQRYPDQWIIWCERDLESHMDISKLKEALHHDVMMISDLTVSNPVPKDIAYIEESPFLKIAQDVRYPTWQMSKSIGAIHGTILNQLDGQLKVTRNFDYFLNLIAKSCQAQGLFCYHVPLLNEWFTPTKQDSSFNPYSFIAKTSKKRWVFFLLLCHLVYEKRFPLFSFLKGVFTLKLQIHFSAKDVESKNNFPEHSTVDVIIPTMGRATYLYNVLKDFAVQTVLPEKIIIIEQNADMTASSELGYLTAEAWPFEIVHSFIHNTGACNARNLALAQTDATWTFFADDDNRFEPTVIENALDLLKKYGSRVLTTSYLQEGERKVFTVPKQWTTFGSGNSFVEGTLSRKHSFNTSYEHGYGEDTDYGMQLRNAGADILYHPDIDLVHLKAPVGGFRNEVKHPWGDEEVAPKPSPTVMLYRLKHTTSMQLKGYKLRLFLRQLTKKKPLHLLKFSKQYKIGWNNAVKWAKMIDKR